MIWEQFEAAAPEMAAVGRAQFEQSGVVLIGTLRKDGFPRISCVEPCILDGVLYLGMMWQSRKALDLLQDPRIAVHNTICTSTGDEVEFSLRGRANSANWCNSRKSPRPRRRVPRYRRRPSTTSTA